MAKQNHEPGPPMTLGSLRQLGVRGLLRVCLDPKCGHEATMSVDDYPDQIELPSFAPRMACSKCGGKRMKVRPNWKEMPIMEFAPDFRLACRRSAQARDGTSRKLKWC